MHGIVQQSRLILYQSAVTNEVTPVWDIYLSILLLNPVIPNTYTKRYVNNCRMWDTACTLNTDTDDESWDLAHKTIVVISAKQTINTRAQHMSTSPNECDQLEQTKRSRSLSFTA